MTVRIEKIYITKNIRERANDVAGFVDRAFASSAANSPKQLFFPTIAHPPAVASDIKGFMKWLVMEEKDITQLMEGSMAVSGDKVAIEQGESSIALDGVALRFNRLGAVEEGWQALDKDRRWRRAASICMQYSYEQLETGAVQLVEQRFTLATTERQCAQREMPFLRQSVVTVGPSDEVVNTYHVSKPIAGDWVRNNFMALAQPLYDLRKA